MAELNGQPPPNRRSSWKISYKQQVRWRRMFLYTIVPASATTVLGGTVGILTGFSAYHNNDVLAATLPALLSVGGIAAYVVVGRENKAGGDKRLTWVVSGLVILFSMAFLAGINSGVYFREDYRTREQNAAEKAIYDRYINKMMECSIQQFLINNNRKELNLLPLTIHQICPSVPAGSSYSIPKETLSQEIP